MKWRLTLLVCVTTSAWAQGVPRLLDDRAAETLTHVPLGKAEVVFDAGAEKMVKGRLKKPLCVEAMKLCAPAGSTVQFLVGADGTVRLERMTAPRPFSAWGLTFAANATVTTGHVYQRADRLPIEGTLAAPVELDGLLVTGPVMLELDEERPVHVRFGTLAREAS